MDGHTMEVERVNWWVTVVVSCVGTETLRRGARRPDCSCPVRSRELYRNNRRKKRKE